LQAFRAKDAPLDPDVLVCFRNLSGYMLSKSTGLWTRFHFSARPWLGFHYPVGVRGAEYPLTHWSSGSQPFVTQLEPGRFIHLF
ncbi:hypothetical protein, partial [Staphylococcus gallinarum]|uniref:hypothetical protein n=2 Tax=Bacteria TaxID=2 RepID=UPI003174899D